MSPYPDGLGSAAADPAGTFLQSASNLSDLAARQTALDNIAGAVTSGLYLRGNGTHVALGSISAADLPAGTTGAQGALQLDGTAAHILADGTQAAGANGGPPDSGHIHPADFWLPGDNGLLAACGELAGYLSSSSILTAGTIYAVKIPVRKPFTATNTVWAVASSGSGTSTQSFTALLSPAGAILSGSSDIGAKFVSGGSLPACPLTTPQALTPGTTAFVWAVLLLNLGTTQPTLFKAGGTGSVGALNGGTTSTTFRHGTYTSLSQTALPGSFTPGSNLTAGGFTFFAALS